MQTLVLPVDTKIVNIWKFGKYDILVVVVCLYEIIFVYAVEQLVFEFLLECKTVCFVE
jgi:hypothetical protein